MSSIVSGFFGYPQSTRQVPFRTRSTASCFRLHLLDYPRNLIGRRVGFLGPFPHLFGHDRGHDLLHPLGRLGHNLAPVRAYSTRLPRRRQAAVHFWRFH